jgi:transglutaminase-like putative cysteine protease
MKKFILGLVMGVMLSGGVVFGANQIYEATRSSQTFYVDGKQEVIEAYSIHDNNFIKLRDLGKYIDFGVEYDGTTNSVYIDTNGTYSETPKATPSPTPAPANSYDKVVESYVASISNLSAEDKVKNMADYLCDRMTYDFDYAEAVKNNTPYYNKAGTNEVIFGEGNGKGVCGTYARCFKYLCKKANIPCVTVSDFDHAWNEVYVNGSWKIVDVTNYDTARSDVWMLTDYSKYPKQDDNPTQTAKDKAETLK